MSLPPPAAFGLPPKFSEWREHQAEACESIAGADARFLLLVCPTGFGKSVVYMSAARLLMGRTVVLTSTKGLQSQLMADFGGEDVVDIRGRGNYPCRLNTKVSCDSGMCSFGVKCSLKSEGGCFYYDQLRRAMRAKVVVTNYAYWMAQNEYSSGLGEFQLLVLDEAHSAPDHLIDHISVRFSKKNKLESRLLRLNGSLPNDARTWSDWALERLVEVEEEMGDAKALRKEKKFVALKRLSKKLERIQEIDGRWVWEDNPDAVTLSPLWPAPFAESHLFLGVPQVVLTSATVVPKTASLLGVNGGLKVREYPHSFPVEHRPLIHVPTVRMNYRIGEAENRQWVTRVDQVIRDRLDRKGIIHTVSYARRDLILQRSKYREYMVSHGRRDTESVVRSFKRMEAPAILVSPSMATGWDFPEGECRWQIIVKLPYPDTRGVIIKARSKADRDFTAYLVMQQLIQATGRGVRSKEDWCETFVTDNNITWFLVRNEHLTVEWFKGAYRLNKTIPKPIGGSYG